MPLGPIPTQSSRRSSYNPFMSPDAADDQLQAFPKKPPSPIHSATVNPFRQRMSSSRTLRGSTVSARSSPAQSPTSTATSVGPPLPPRKPGLPHPRKPEQTQAVLGLPHHTSKNRSRSNSLQKPAPGPKPAGLGLVQSTYIGPTVNMRPIQTKPRSLIDDDQISMNRASSSSSGHSVVALTERSPPVAQPQKPNLTGSSINSLASSINDVLPRIRPPAPPKRQITSETAMSPDFERKMRSFSSNSHTRSASATQAGKVGSSSTTGYNLHGKSLEQMLGKTNEKTQDWLKSATNTIQARRGHRDERNSLIDRTVTENESSDDDDVRERSRIGTKQEGHWYTTMAYAAEFLPHKHISFALRCLRFLPHYYQAEDGNRMSLAFFALSSLDVLNAMDRISERERADCIDWIYSNQLPTGGFRGSPVLNQSEAHLVMTYTALLCLAILRDDFKRMSRQKTLAFVKTCQDEATGSFAPHPSSNERDVRMTYCAFVICHLLQDWKGVNKSKGVHYLLQCRTYEGGFGQEPNLEAQGKPLKGGSTYCVLASLHLAGVQLQNKDLTLAWLAHRHVMPDAAAISEDMVEDIEDDVQFALAIASMAGMQGRANKLPDACYSFWVGASLKLLQPELALPSWSKESAFLFACQDARIGGIAKSPFVHPDIYHTYLALAAFSLHRRLPTIAILDPAVNISLSSLQCLTKQLALLSG